MSAPCSSWCVTNNWRKLCQRRPWGSTHCQPHSPASFRYFLNRALRRADQFPPTIFLGGCRWDVSARSKPLVYQAFLGIIPSLSFVQPLPVSLPDLVAPQRVSAQSQLSASTTHNPTSRQNRSIKDWADPSRYPTNNLVTLDRGSPTSRSSANACSSQPQSRAG